MADAAPFDFANFSVRLRELAHCASQSQLRNPRNLTNTAIELGIDALQKVLGLGQVHLVTVRERSGFRRERLRHVYASNPTVRAYFDLEGTGHAGIESAAFDDPRARYHDAFTSPGCNTKCYVAAYAISRGAVQAQPSRWNLGRKHVFPDRIREFLSEPKKNGLSASTLKSIRQCLVLGLRRDKRRGAVDQLAALYTSRAPAMDALQQNARLCASIATAMFCTIDEIHVRASMEFERRALTDIVGLVDDFADEQVSPSDAVSTLLSTIADIFKDHEYFGAGRFQIGPQRKEQHQWVTFLTVTYKEAHGAEKFTPVLAVHPKSESRKNYRQSYWISRPNAPSISKYLLYRFLETLTPHLTPRQIFEELHAAKVDKNAFIRPAASRHPMGLVLTSADPAYGVLQCPFFRKEAKTTAAFLLQNTARSERPFAVMVFESDCADAFSRSDVQLISRLVDASASLLSNIKLPSSSIDYSNRLKEAFASRSGQKVGAVPYYRIAYELMRVDLHAAIAVLQSQAKSGGSELLGEGNALCKSEVRREVLAVLRELRTLSGPGGAAAVHRWLWNNATYERIKFKWGGGIEDIHAFLVAVPSSDIWHCYLGSIDRALAHRNFSADQPPTFTQFRPGYSALAMFIVDNARETRQIAKLTTKEKLQKEKDNYDKHVRYKVPLAARIPANGIAFDTDGSTPDRKRPNEGYGVIVSDLIAGNSDLAAGRPTSLLSLCSDFVGGARDARSPTIDDVIGGIDYHFRENIRIWREEAADKWPARPIDEKDKGCVLPFIEEHMGTGARVKVGGSGRSAKEFADRLRDVTRVLSEGSSLSTAAYDMLQETEAYYASNIHECDTLLGATATDLRSLIENVIERRIYDLDAEGDLESMVTPKCFIPAYVHGDLNGNNLTWAAHYNRFAMIDFESISLGFMGVDQLKLFASMVCETVSSPRRMPEHRERLVTEKEHRATMALVRLIRWLINDVISNSNTTDRANVLDTRVADTEEDLSRIALAIIRTIGFDAVDLSTHDRQLFWRLALRNLYCRQFEYAYRDLGTDQTEAMRTATTAIREACNPRAGNQGAEDVNVLVRVNDSNVIQLFYSYMALLAAL